MLWRLMGVACLLALMGAGAGAETSTAMAVAEFGAPRHDASQGHFPYVNPDAPRGGSVTIGTVGTFDSLNPIILKGKAPNTLGLVQDPLMVESLDELYAVYGLIAESVTWPEDRSWAEFTLNPAARWHDGVPVSAEDVVWTYERIMEIGQPFLQSWFEGITKAEVVGERRVRFTFESRGSMRPIRRIAGLIPQPRHWWEKQDITRTTTEPLLGNGPYRIARVEPGVAITYERAPDYWARDHWVNRGHHNFDGLRYEFYRDSGVMFEGFIGGASDFRFETGAQRWATGYTIPAVDDRRLIREEVPRRKPRGPQAYFINERRPQFKDPRTREAIALLFNFEWVNQELLFNAYERVDSYFLNSEFAAGGAAGPLEQTLLRKAGATLSEAALAAPCPPPRTPDLETQRAHTRRALGLLQEAGWRMRDNVLVDANGRPLTFEISLRFPGLERLTQLWLKNLERVGIRATLRVVERAQWKERMDRFDFDIAATALTFNPPPGTELRSYFGSAAAAENGSANFAGIADPVVDRLIETIVAAPDEEHLIAAARALDRVLMCGHHMVPQWYAPTTRMAYWSKLARPENLPPLTVGFPQIWWMRPR